MNRDQDFDLVARCQEGDRRAMEALVRRYQRPVYNAAFRLLGNADDAADVTQTTFLKAFENIQRFDTRQKFFSWLYRIGINESLDQLKRSQRFEPMVENAVSPGERPQASAARAEDSIRLQQALMELNQDCRTVLVLRYFTECSYRQISEILGIPDKTVKSRLYEGRQKLRTKLKDCGLIST